MQQLQKFVIQLNRRTEAPVTSKCMCMPSQVPVLPAPPRPEVLCLMECTPMYIHNHLQEQDMKMVARQIPYWQLSNRCWLFGQMFVTQVTLNRFRIMRADLNRQFLLHTVGYILWGKALYSDYCSPCPGTCTLQILYVHAALVLSWRSMLNCGRECCDCDTGIMGAHLCHCCYPTYLCALSSILRFCFTIYSLCHNCECYCLIKTVPFCLIYNCL